MVIFAVMRNDIEEILRKILWNRFLPSLRGSEASEAIH